MREPVVRPPALDQATEGSFDDLALDPALVKAVRDSGYLAPTPIQARTIPHLLAGRDLLGCAKTGTGKTAAFALPILQRLFAGTRGQHGPRALVLVPTRELASQVHESFLKYGQHLGVASVTVYGGVSQVPQVRALRRGVDVVVATPGRLVDLIGQGHARLNEVEVLVLDEADHMLDLGFVPDVRRILARLPTKRQTLLFSATMPPPIAALAREILSNPAEVRVAPQGEAVDLVEQRVHFVDRDDKLDVLATVLRAGDIERALVFARTKHGADRVAKRLARDGIPASAIHGNKSQGARERTLADFKSGKVPILIATDIAARGIDVQGISHVINYELPNIPETYIHRIGRTARAGAKGIAISLCSRDERPFLVDIEKLQRRNVPVLPAPAITRRLPPPLQPERPERPPFGRGRGGDSRSDARHSPRHDPRPHQGDRHDSRSEPRHDPRSAPRHADADRAPRAPHAPGSPHAPAAPRPSHGPRSPYAPRPSHSNAPRGNFQPRRRR